MKPSHPPSPSVSPGANVLERNIGALLERRRRQDREKNLQDRIADAISRFAGSLPFVYVHAGVVMAWVVINLRWTPFPKFDPTFIILATAASVEAIFLSTFVLIT